MSKVTRQLHSNPRACIATQTPGYEGAFGERGAEEVVFTLLCGIPSLARQCSHSVAARLRHQEVNAQCWDPLLVSDSAGLGRDL